MLDMNHDHMVHMNDYQPIMAGLAVIGLIAYLWAALTTNRRNRLRKWPPHRYGCWCLGVICAAAAVVGPLANRAHTDFVAHMAGHLLIGMLAPLLMVLAAPMTLLLRTLEVRPARRVSRILHSRPVRFMSHPVVAATLNIGGLWLLYMTVLYMEMQQHFILHFAIHFHVFMAGYLFTSSLIYIDPVAHRYSFVYRAAVLLVSLAGHAVLAKCIYAVPPAGVSRPAGEAGAILMYYGGDVIDMVIIFILCLQWYKSARPRLQKSARSIAMATGDAT